MIVGRNQMVQGEQEKYRWPNDVLEKKSQRMLPNTVIHENTMVVHKPDASFAFAAMMDVSAIRSVSSTSFTFIISLICFFIKVHFKKTRVTTMSSLKSSNWNEKQD